MRRDRANGCLGPPPENGGAQGVDRTAMPRDLAASRHGACKGRNHLGEAFPSGRYVKSGFGC